MKYCFQLWVVILGSLIMLSCSGPVTTIYIVRHADRDGKADALTDAGYARAEHLAHVVGGEYHKARIAAIFTTQTDRTFNTIKPLADVAGKNPQYYENPEDLAAKVLKEYPGGTVVVAGHSNTCSQLIEAFGAEAPFRDLPHWQYDDLFQVRCQARKKASLTCLKYGPPTPGE